MSFCIHPIDAKKWKFNSGELTEVNPRGHGVAIIYGDVPIDRMCGVVAQAV